MLFLPLLRDNRLSCLSLLQYRRNNNIRGALEQVLNEDPLEARNSISGFGTRLITKAMKSTIISRISSESILDYTFHVFHFLKRAYRNSEIIV